MLQSEKVDYFVFLNKDEHLSTIIDRKGLKDLELQKIDFNNCEKKFTDKLGVASVTVIVPDF